MSTTSHDQSDSASFHDRDRNQLRTILAKSEEAIGALVSLSESVHELHVDAMVVGTDGNLNALSVLSNAFDALRAIRSITATAKAVLADHQVKP